jgi:hypothetical protein
VKSAAECESLESSPLFGYQFLSSFHLLDVRHVVLVRPLNALSAAKACVTAEGKK